MWSWHGGGAWGWFVGTLLTVAFWGALVWLVVQVARDRDATARRGLTPEGILAERYARGEIDTDEYRRRLDELSVGSR